MVAQPIFFPARPFIISCAVVHNFLRNHL
jgi:hypothetical protein